MSSELPRKISYGPVDKMTVGLLRTIHLTLLPVTYSPQIYNLIVEGKKAKGILAYFNDDHAVGELCYRLEENDGEKQIYIMTIGVLKPYQRLGIASGLMQKVIDEHPEVSSVYLHVLETNTAAISFYTKLGFTMGETIPSYYKSLENGNAIVFKKQLK